MYSDFNHRSMKLQFFLDHHSLQDAETHCSFSTSGTLPVNWMFNGSVYMPLNLKESQHLCPE